MRKVRNLLRNVKGKMALPSFWLLFMLPATEARQDRQRRAVARRAGQGPGATPRGLVERPLVLVGDAEFLPGGLVHLQLDDLLRLRIHRLQLGPFFVQLSSLAAESGFQGLLLIVQTLYVGVEAFIPGEKVGVEAPFPQPVRILLQS